jgi:hypothetical protein
MKTYLMPGLNAEDFRVEFRTHPDDAICEVPETISKEDYLFLKVEWIDDLSNIPQKKAKVVVDEVKKKFHQDKQAEEKNKLKEKEKEIDDLVSSLKVKLEKGSTLTNEEVKEGFIELLKYLMI